MECNRPLWKAMEDLSYVWHINHCRSHSKDERNEIN